MDLSGMNILENHNGFRAFMREFDSKDLDVFLNWANEPIWTIEKAENVTSKMLNHWEKCEIIPFKDEFEKHRERRFSTTELMWFFVVVQLREFGLSLQKIGRVKEHLIKLEKELVDDAISFEFHKDKVSDWSARSSPVLDVVLHYSYFQFQTVFLIVDTEGRGTLLTQHEYCYKADNEEIGSCLIIDLKKIVSGMFPNRDFAKRPLSEIRKLDRDILGIVTMLYQGKVSELTVKKKGGEIDRAHITTIEDANAIMSKLMREADYQEITIQQEKGSVKHIRRTEKVKF